VFTSKEIDQNRRRPIEKEREKKIIENILKINTYF
jgi:hypothetical protein